MPPEDEPLPSGASASGVGGSGGDPMNVAIKEEQQDELLQHEDQDME